MSSNILKKLAEYGKVSLVENSFQIDIHFSETWSHEKGDIISELYLNSLFKKSLEKMNNLLNYLDSLLIDGSDSVFISTYANSTGNDSERGYHVSIYFDIAKLKE